MKNLILYMGLLCCFTAASQPLDLKKKQLRAQRINEPIKIDGKLDEISWAQAAIATDLVVSDPVPGTTPSQKTEIKVLYDDNGLYVGAMLYDTSPDSILQELSQRDDFGNTDWFGIFIDAYRDGINGTSFITTPAGVQFDAKYSTFGEDSNWDAVWEAQTTITNEGWIVEMKIPYSAIRFPSAPEQTWHLNFGRMLRRKQEKSWWSELKPEVDGFLNQSGYLTHIKNIKSPVRLSATPFIAVYGEHYHDSAGDPQNSFGRSINGGMDIKYGITDAFTLDMTLIPDFGEAQSDNQVLNLSPFEVRFDENRQFFTEGIELFNKGNLFYSRRVGGRPLHYWSVEDDLAEGEEVVDNPSQVQLYNATKISGRTNSGLGIGAFNATAGRTFARIRDSEGIERTVETNPLTNYNVLVFDQNLKNNSYATLINTTVLRAGDDYEANVTAAVFELRDKKNAYSLSGKAALSQKYFTDETDLGHTYDLSFRKNSGRLQWGTSYAQESDTYDPNDLGILFNNNEQSVTLWGRYNFFKPVWKFNQARFGVWNRYSRLYNPNTFTDYGVEIWSWAQSKGFWNFNFWTYIEPFVTYDYFEPRTDGRFYRFPTSNNVGFWMGTDSRKKLRFSISGNRRNFGEAGRNQIRFRIGPRYRVNDRLNFNWTLGFNKRNGDVGFVDKITGSDTEEEDIIFGRRDRDIIENVFRTNYNFNANMALSFRLRHYWDRVDYTGFHLLDQEGNLQPTDYDESQNANFNAFNIDMVYRWRFAPGSDIIIVWKNAILESTDALSADYFDNLNGLFEAPQRNSLSIKVIYFLDYLDIAAKNKDNRD